MNFHTEKAHDLAAIIKPDQENKWVAIAWDYSSIVAAADALEDLIRETKDRAVIYYRVLPGDATFAPSIL